MTATALLLITLVKCGIINVFGIVGGEAQAIRFDEIKDINFYLTRHEFTAGIAADVQARLTRQPQVCYSTSGPGLTNLSTGVFSAIQDRSPVLVISAQIPTKEIIFNQMHQCLDNVKFMRPITKFSAEICNIESIPELVQKALQIAVNDIPGPVYLSFPLDVMQETIKDEEAFKLLKNITKIYPDRADMPETASIDKVGSLISQADNPIIVIGNQVIREKASKSIISFAEKLNIPVVCTLASKGVFREDHHLFVCTANKYLDEIYKKNIIGTLFKDVDLIILVGYDIGEDLKPSLWGNNKRTVLINSFYKDVSEVFVPDVACIGDLNVSLPSISNEVDKKYNPEKALQIKKILQGGVSVDLEDDCTDIPKIIEMIRTSLAEDGILCSDIGLHKQYAGLLSQTFVENSFICSNVCGTFGFGLPSAIATRLVNKNNSRRIVLICGDGGFHSGSQDIETAVRYNLPFVIVLLKDNEFGLIKYYQLLKSREPYNNSVRFGDVDFVKLAEANGASGCVINDIKDLPSALEDGFSKESVYLIEVPVKYGIQLKEKY